MITRCAAFATSDQQTFAELDAAIGHELALIFDDEPGSAKAVETILKNRDKIVDLLTTTATSKSRARKVNGGTKKRRTAADTAAAVNRELQDGKQ